MKRYLLRRIIPAFLPILVLMVIWNNPKEPVPQITLIEPVVNPKETPTIPTSTSTELSAYSPKIVKKLRWRNLFKSLSKTLLRKKPREINHRELQPVLAHPPKVWISLSVCFSGNTQYHKKENFPYLEAAKMSTHLWHQVANLSTVVQVVYNEKDHNATNLALYVDVLRNLGSLVYPIVNDGDLECSLKAQMQRMFVSHVPEIKNEDLVVTSDVDIFPMVPNVLDELKRDYKIWLFQYAQSEVNQDTFSMSFIAMTKAQWMQLLPQNTPEDTIHHFLPTVLTNEETRWNYDQMIISAVILESGICSLDPRNRLWKMLQMKPANPQPSDQKRCFHGDRWWDCNKVRKSIPTGCLMWHFYPDEDAQQLRKKFQSILMSNKKRNRKS